MEVNSYFLLYSNSSINREWDIWILHQKQKGMGDHLKMGRKLSSIKGSDIYVLLCCCNKGKGVKKNDKNRNETFSVNWPNKKNVPFSMKEGSSIYSSHLYFSICIIFYFRIILSLVLFIHFKSVYI